MRNMTSRAVLFATLAVLGLAGTARAGRVRLRGETIDTEPAHRAFGRSARSIDKVDAELQERRSRLPPATPLLVQLDGPVGPKRLGLLERQGAEIVGYVPDHAVLLRVNPDRIETLAALPFVQWVGEYKAQHKLHPEMAALARRAADAVSTQAPARARMFGPAPAAAPATPALRASDYAAAPAYDQPRLVTVVLFNEADRGAVADGIARQGGTVTASASTRGGGQLRAELTPRAAAALAGLPSVRWIEPYREPRLLNNVAAQGPRMNADYVWTNFVLTGSNQIIAVCDTGLDNGSTNTIHPDFSNKIHRAIARGRAGDWSDNNGHGTHVSGSVLGSGRAFSNGLYRGIARDAKLVIQSVEDEDGYLSGIPEDLNDLFLEAYTNDARIHSDSWGSSVDGAYTSDARQADEFLWNHQDMLIVFAAGNDGADSLPTGNPDGVVDEDSLSAPGTAKNVLTVGASENARTNGGHAASTWSIFGYYADPLSNDMVSASYDGTNQGIAAFSSRGPCDDGRTKPDIVAPGTDIISCRSRKISSVGWGAVDGTTNYMYSGGTSMATPLTAGAAGLVRQYLVERRGITNPPGALIKAMLLNGARSLTPGQYGTGGWREIPDQARPNNVEGWGQVNLGETLQPPPGRTNALHTGQVATGETNTYTFISAHTNTLSVVLAWHDYPGELAAAQALVNDLDLRVTTPAGQLHLGNGVVGGDRINNVEGSRHLPAHARHHRRAGRRPQRAAGHQPALCAGHPGKPAELRLPSCSAPPMIPSGRPTSRPSPCRPSCCPVWAEPAGSPISTASTPAPGWRWRPRRSRATGRAWSTSSGSAGTPSGTRVDYYAVAYDSTGAAQTSVTNSFYVAALVAYVKTNGTPVPPYHTWATAATNLNDAINAVIPGGVVWVTNGTYDGEVVIRKSCTVKSVNGQAVTIIDGRGTSRCVKMDGVVYSVLDGFTLTNGVSPNGEVLGDKAGGGVLLREYAVVQNCLITGNRAHVRRGRSLLQLEVPLRGGHHQQLRDPGQLRRHLLRRRRAAGLRRIPDPQHRPQQPGRRHGGRRLLRGPGRLHGEQPDRRQRGHLGPGHRRRRRVLRRRHHGQLHRGQQHGGGEGRRQLHLHQQDGEHHRVVEPAGVRLRCR
jgi:hypothetical protein